MTKAEGRKLYDGIKRIIGVTQPSQKQMKSLKVFRWKEGYNSFNLGNNIELVIDSSGKFLNLDNKTFPNMPLPSALSLKTFLAEFYAYAELTSNNSYLRADQYGMKAEAVRIDAPASKMPIELLTLPAKADKKTVESLMFKAREILVSREVSITGRPLLKVIAPTYDDKITKIVKHENQVYVCELGRLSWAKDLEDALQLIKLKDQYMRLMRILEVASW